MRGVLTHSSKLKSSPQGAHFTIQLSARCQSQVNTEHEARFVLRVSIEPRGESSGCEYGKDPVIMTGDLQKQL